MIFYSSVIEENKSNQAILFITLGKMLNRLAPKKLHSVDLANKFAEFFVHQVETVRNSLNSPGLNPNDEKIVCPAANELAINSFK